MTVEMHHIGEVADAVGLSLHTIRNDDEATLVIPSGRSATSAASASAITSRWPRRSAVPSAGTPRCEAERMAGSSRTASTRAASAATRAVAGRQRAHDEGDTTSLHL